MATTLLFRTTRAKIDSLELDASETESHSSEVDVTEYPVESGFNISDHAREKPETLSITGIISNTPLTKPVGEDYVSLALAMLRDLKTSHRLVKVVTSLRTYDDMVLTKLDIPRNSQSSTALRFTASFKQIKIVELRRAVVKVPKDIKAKPKVKTGSQPTKKNEVEADWLTQISGGLDENGNDRITKWTAEGLGVNLSPGGKLKAP